jgi:hypothetical protein
MAQSQALLLIADIGGYTKYMRLHRVSLAHAQANIARLLETVIDAVPRLELIEIEGDAAFLSSPLAGHDDSAAKAATEAAVAMHRAFHTELQQMIALNMCSCDGCAQTRDLKLKFIAHVGEVATQTIRGRKSLVGVDVILVHRLLKNTVPLSEYVLLSEDLYRRGEAAIGRAALIEEELEGLGRTRAYFIDLSEIADAVPPTPPARVPKRVAATLGVMGRGLPYVLGIRRPRAAAAD